MLLSWFSSKNNTMKLQNLLNLNPQKKALKQAQELVWEAMEEFSPQSQKALAKKALELSEDCADAYSILATLTSSQKKGNRAL